jgi:CRP-like cAMP-binding protein
VEASTRNATSIPAESGPDRPGGILFLDTKTPGALANKLLAALPHADSEALKSHFTIVPLAQGTVLFGVDDEVDQIFFPLSGMVSLLVILKNGNAIETATTGREGVVGAMAGLGLHKSRVRDPSPHTRSSISQNHRQQPGDLQSLHSI